jgi:phenylpyruvate tautomerase PptA (4-oxalocrotonate tautomerase family)
MPFLRFYSPELPVEQKRLMAQELTEAVLRALHLPDQARDWTTVQFVPFRSEDFAVAGRLMSDTDRPDYHLEFTDRGLNRTKKEALVRILTPLLARLLDLPPDETDRINIQFNEYHPEDMAVGGHFLDRLPR